VSRPKRIPQRTCVGCRTTGEKRAFVRAVRTPEGTVGVDLTGKRNGRGAYLCPQRACWEEALKKGRLARALRTTISPRELEELRRQAEQFERAAVTSGS
jgi:predicted RNA-binding protein YlxR (DUF448 family)